MFMESKDRNETFFGESTFKELNITTFTKGRLQAMSDEKIVHLNEGVIKSELKELVRNNVEKTLNGLLEQEAQSLTNTAKYERTGD